MKFLPTGLHHIWQLLRNGRVGGDVVELAPDPSTNILRNVTNPVERQDAATRGWVVDNFASVTRYSGTAGDTTTLPNIADVELGALYIVTKTDANNVSPYTVSGDANISGQASLDLFNRYESYILKSNGITWEAHSHYRFDDVMLVTANYTITAESPSTIIIASGIELSISFASLPTLPSGKIYTVVNDVLPAEFADPSEWNAVAIADKINDNFTESQQISWELGPSNYAQFVVNGNKAHVINRGNRVVRAVTADYSAQTYDDVILVDATAGDVTISLPDLGANEYEYHASYYIKRKDSSANIVTVQQLAPGLIDGQADFTMAQWESFEIISDDSQYYII